MIYLSSNISESLEALTKKLDETIKDFDAKALETAAKPLDELYKQVHETIREKLRDPVERLVKKLKEDEALTPEENEVIVKWVVGDAKYYTRMENNLIDWMGECKRLFDVLTHYTFEGIEEDENRLLALGALLTDLKFTLKDVIRYSEAMNRVDQFKSLACVGTPNTESKKLIAEMIERKLID